jgi:hypothetical protein
MSAPKIVPDKNLLPYWLLAGFALVHLIFLLGYVPALLPYTSDDVWMAWEGFHAPLPRIFSDSWTSALQMGRLSLFLQYVISDFAYRYPAESYLWQSFPLLLTILAGAGFTGWYTGSIRAGLSLFILMGLGSFITGPHHLFSSYPAAFPLGLACSFAYLYVGLQPSRGNGLFVLARIVLFLFPLFIYEAFFPLQIAALMVIACRNFRDDSNGTFLRKTKNFLYPVCVELVVLTLMIVAYMIVSHLHLGRVYQGTTLAHSYALIPYTFIKYATGFFPLPMSSESMMLFCITGLYIYAIDKKQTPYAALATYFLIMWLVPPLLLSLTPKYQYWAHKNGPLGSPVYVTTFLSEMGCFGLITLLCATRAKHFQLLVVTLLSLFMWISWREETAHVIEQRLSRFANLDAAVMQKKRDGEENCFTIDQAKSLLLPWEYCEYEDSCTDVTPDILTTHGSKLCAEHNGH